MPRHELHSSDVKPQQKADIDLGLDDLEREPEIVKAEGKDLEDKDRLANLAFAEEPLTIVIHPSSEKNAASSHPVWNQGLGAEILINGKWRSITWLPFNQQLVTKRKYVEIMARAKFDRVETITPQINNEDTLGTTKVQRFTSPVLSFSIIRDDNPKGAAWINEMLRRNF